MTPPPPAFSHSDRKPFLYHMGKALATLPAYDGVTFRGIDCAVSAELYAPGTVVTWPAFSSSTTSARCHPPFTTPLSLLYFFDFFTSRTSLSYLQLVRIAITQYRFLLLFFLELRDVWRP